MLVTILCVIIVILVLFIRAMRNGLKKDWKKFDQIDKLAQDYENKYYEARKEIELFRQGAYYYDIINNPVTDYNRDSYYCYSDNLIITSYSLILKDNSIVNMININLRNQKRQIPKTKKEFDEFLITELNLSDKNTELEELRKYKNTYDITKSLYVDIEKEK